MTHAHIVRCFSSTLKYVPSIISFVYGRLVSVLCRHGHPSVMERVLDVLKPPLQIGEVQVDALVPISIKAHKDEPHCNWQVHRFGSV